VPSGQVSDERGEPHLGYVLLLDGRPGEAVAPLLEALVASRQLPEYVQSIIPTIVDLLRFCYAENAERTAEVFRAVTGQDVPAWMKEPPASPD
jgi:hypothetical protein